MGATEDQATPNEQLARRGPFGEDVDTIADEICDVLSENAEDFVRAYVQKGGQGWTSFLDPAFFVGAAAAGVAAAATWDTFKVTMTKVIKAIRQTRAQHDEQLKHAPDEMFNPDGSLSEFAEHQIQYSWKRAKNLLTEDPPGHDIDEANALHWMVFLSELHKATGMVKLRPEHYDKIVAAAAAAPEQLQPSHSSPASSKNGLGNIQMPTSAYTGTSTSYRSRIHRQPLLLAWMSRLGNLAAAAPIATSPQPRSC